MILVIFVNFFVDLSENCVLEKTQREALTQVLDN